MRFDDALLAATEEACQREPMLARTRLALLRVEKAAHRAGWGVTWPTLWRVEYDPARHYVHTRLSSSTKVLALAIEQCGGDLGEALLRLATVMEVGRERLAEAGMPRHEDLFDAELPGQRFYGFALMSEAWSTREAATPSEQAAVAAGRLYLHPDRVETRTIFLAARDGLAWWAVRVRREPPVEIAMFRPEADSAPQGLMYHVLARMTAAMVGNVVPVPPLVTFEEA